MNNSMQGMNGMPMNNSMQGMNSTQMNNSMPVNNGMQGINRCSSQAAHGNVNAALRIKANSVSTVDSRAHSKEGIV